MPDFAAVDADRSLDVGTFQEQCHAAPLPFLRNLHGPAVSHFSHKRLRRCQEEGELHLTSLAVRLHERIEEIAGIIQGPCPLRVHRHFVTYTVCKQRSGECNGAVTKTGRRIPGSGERDGFVR